MHDSITLAGGCFWCLEAVYLRVKGVSAVESGYCNGHVLRPTYEQICNGDTGHAEVVKVTFDASQVSLNQLLEIFFVIHDCTTKNRQGNDVGTQYRSGIYWHSAEQETSVHAFMDGLVKEPALAGRITTELAAIDNYSRAEDCHQNYFAQHPNQGYCAFVVAPKVEKFKKTFTALLND